MIIDAYATDTTPSHEVRRRALEALANAGEPMSEVTYDALRKRLAQAETEIEKLRAALRGVLTYYSAPTPIEAKLKKTATPIKQAYAALGEKE
jgi:hypothetical protein